MWGWINLVMCLGHRYGTNCKRVVRTHRHVDGSKAAGGRIYDRIDQILPRCFLNVDFIDEHDRILDQHSHQAQEAEQGHEAEGVSAEKQPRGHADDGEWHIEPIHQGLSQRVEERDRGDDHEEDEKGESPPA